MEVMLLPKVVQHQAGCSFHKTPYIGDAVARCIVSLSLRRHVEEVQQQLIMQACTAEKVQTDLLACASCLQARTDHFKT